MNRIKLKFISKMNESYQYEETISSILKMKNLQSLFINKKEILIKNTKQKNKAKRKNIKSQNILEIKKVNNNSSIKTIHIENSKEKLEKLSRDKRIKEYSHKIKLKNKKIIKKEKEKRMEKEKEKEKENENKKEEEKTKEKERQIEKEIKKEKERQIENEIKKEIENKKEKEKIKERKKEIVKNKAIDKNKKNMNLLSPKKNSITKGGKTSKENKSKNITKNKTEPKLDLNKNKTLKKTKETISTTLDTLSPEKDKEKNILVLNEDNNPNFARIPRLIRRQSRLATGTTFNAKDVEKAIKLRRKQYNEYLKNLNKPKEVKPEPVIESESSSSSESEPKVYDSNKVNTIQKIYRGYQNKKIYQLVDRLKINSCVTELLCLIFCRVYIHAKKRISFGILKTYYHVPFSNICEEMDFKDKIAIRLPDRYYNFKYLVEYEYYVL